MENTLPVSHAALLERTAETFHQAYFIYHCGKHQMQYLNQAFREVVGLSREEALADASRLLQQVHPDDHSFLMEQYQKLQGKGTQKGIEVRLVLPGQNLKWVCLSVTVLEEAGERYLCGFAEDVTLRKEYQNNILKFNSKKNSTLEILSHDLAAPFQNIQGMMGMLETEIESASPATVELMDYIKENAKKGSDMIRDFVDNEFLESSQVVLHKERVNIIQKLTIMMDNYQHLGGALLEKNFVAQLPSEPVYVYLDVMKFMQALNNLVSNAIKFTNDTGTITTSLENLDNSVIIKISDDGIGIPEHLQPVLFDKFTKARREGLHGEKSVGLGMSIIKNIVELHKGNIWFESHEGQGSTFFVEVPKA
ncbi:sensor histidine kinase [Rufibacter hautae]|uniref:histidine kinase n=1 Tax=Rufibacter hautae TaxID=2595005 RepID=A0A5B6TA59_9BACT|nr:PAS domain-containing sensor histidine kinase [Rufibacter hautae]KAA3437076.1 PAS domain-containing sensor histidine kinase [Rufibacter hautae]